MAELFGCCRLREFLSFLDFQEISGSWGTLGKFEKAQGNSMGILEGFGGNARVCRKIWDWGGLGQVGVSRTNRYTMLVITNMVL